VYGRNKFILISQITLHHHLNCLNGVAQLVVSFNS